MKFGLKGCLEDDYEDLSCNLVSVDPDPSSPVRLFGDQLRCPAPAAEPSSWTVKVPLPRQGSAALTKALFLCKSSFYMFVNMCKEWT